MKNKQINKQINKISIANIVTFFSVNINVKCVMKILSFVETFAN